MRIFSYEPPPCKYYPGYPGKCQHFEKEQRGKKPQSKLSTVLHFTMYNCKQVSLFRYQNPYHSFIKFITFHSTEIQLPTPVSNQLPGCRKIPYIVLLMYYSQVPSYFQKCYICAYGKSIRRLLFSTQKYIFLQKSYRRRGGMEHTATNSNERALSFPRLQCTCSIFLCPQIHNMHIIWH